MMATKRAEARDHRPVAGTRVVASAPLGDFKALERIPGVTVKGSAVYLPYRGG
jgi:hypothetical protein